MSVRILPKIDEVQSSHQIDEVHPIEEETIYAGTKNFWRTRTNVDFKIILHKLVHCIEVICYDLDKCIESPRIYISEIKLLSKISETEIEEKCQIKREELARKRQRIVDADIVIEITKQLCGNYIVSRATIQENSEKTSDSTWTMVLTPNFNDEVVIDSNTGLPAIDIIMDMPPGLNPTFIRRHRKTNAHEFQSVLGALRADSAKLNAAVLSANKLSGLAESSVSGFKHLLTTRNTMDPCLMSLAKQRWMKAGRKVIIQNTVAKVKIRLERYSLSALPTIKSDLSRNLPKSISKTNLPNQITTPLKKSLSSTIKPKPEGRHSMESINSKTLAATASKNSTKLPSISSSSTAAASHNKDKDKEKAELPIKQENKKLLTAPLPSVAV